MRLLHGRFLRYGIQGIVAASTLGLVLSRIPEETQLTARNPESATVEPVPVWQLETRIYKALRSDEALARLRIGVTVKDRNAELWGFVPDAASEARALAIVGGIPGVGGVASNLRRVAPEDPLLAAVSEALKMQKEGAAYAGGGPTPVVPKQPFGLERDRVALSIPPVDSQRVSTQPVRQRESLTLKPERPEAVGDAGLLSTLEAIRKNSGDGKYADLRVTVVDRSAYISGKVDKKSHALKLADLFAEVPGIERVVMQKIEYR